MNFKYLPRLRVTPSAPQQPPPVMEVESVPAVESAPAVESVPAAKTKRRRRQHPPWSTASIPVEVLHVSGKRDVIASVMEAYRLVQSQGYKRSAWSWAKSLKAGSITFNGATYTRGYKC